MKKLFKALLVFACAGTLCAGALALSACGGGKKGEAYALTHGAERFIGYSSVTVNGDKVKDCVLTEVMLPGELKNEDKELIYKELSYGDVTIVYDATSKAYKVGSQSVTEYFYNNEAHCKEYYEAAVGNKISGKKVDSDASETVSKAVLSKEENGYWSTNLGDKLGWKANRDATVAYVKEYGISGLSSLKKATEGDNTGYWVDGNNVSTGATWSDLYKETQPANYVTYAQLIINAYNVATGK